MDLNYFLELAINGALAGLMYSLVAMGIVLIYKSQQRAQSGTGCAGDVGCLCGAGVFQWHRCVYLAGHPHWPCLPWGPWAWV
jgi:branched-chain amino acid transport system permease protein